MNTGELMRPAAVILEMSPLLVIWVLAISFFVTVAATAIVSRGRRWYELGCIFLLGFLLLSSVAMAAAHYLFDTTIVTVEVIRTNSGNSSGAPD